MVEETKEPERIFPRTMLTGLGIAVIIYMLVAVSVVTVLTSDQIADAADGRALLEVVRVGCAGLPDRQGLPVPGGLRGRQHRADQHADGQPAALRPGQPGRAAARARQGLAEHAGRRTPASSSRPLLALGLIVYVANRAEDDIVVNLASVTALLLLGVFTVVNIACLVLRRDGRESRCSGRPASRRRSRRVACLFLIGPWVDRDAHRLPDRRRAAADRHRALGDHLAHQPRRSAPRRPASATSSTWTSDRRDVRTMRDAGLLARTLEPVSSTVPDLDDPARPRPGPAAGVPRPRGRRRRRRPAADDAAAGLRR